MAYADPALTRVGFCPSILVVPFIQILDPHAPEPSFYGGLATEADHRVPLGAEVSKDDVDLERKRQPDDFSTALAK